MFRKRNTALNFNLNQEEDEELEDLEEQVPTTEPGNEVTAVQLVEREPMFEKPLTPSDVGKLNRLVIPKQHAERHFPLGGGDTVEKGFLLSFEDELGKFWRFRYSYWNSSQSYVLTKGWSRFVKEKRLDAGDVVLFMRHRTDGGRLFIGWRRRAAPVHDSEVAAAAHAGGNGGWTRVFYSAHPYPSHPLPCQPHCLHAGENEETEAGNSKRQIRLFGVNLEYQAEESEPPTPHGSSLSSQGAAHNLYSQARAGSSESHNHLDVGFHFNQMRNGRG